MNKAENMFTWKGLISDLDRRTRFMVYLVFTFMVGTIVFCQLGFLPLGGTRLFLVLVPIALTSLLFGTIGGTVLGAIGGSAMMLHAILLPFDYYEKYFASPINSIVLFALSGFVLGLLFYWVTRIGEKNHNAGFAALIAACFVGSWFASTFFQVNSYLIAAVLNLNIPKELFDVVSGLRSIAIQLVLDALIMVLFTVIAALINLNRTNKPKYERPLRDTFMGWLIVVVTLAFMATAAFSYTFITGALIARANTTLDNHISYVKDQLTERDAWINQIQARGGLSADDREKMISQSIEGIAHGLQLGQNGVTIVAENGVIASSNETGIVGQSFEDVVGAGISGGFSESVYNTARPLEYYYGGIVSASLEDGSGDGSGGGDEGDSGSASSNASAIANAAEISYLKASEISYMRAQQVGKYQVAAIMPGTDVFEYRTLALALMTLVFLIQFVLVFLLAMRLLDQVVVRRIDQTNETLERITEGDLDQMVEVKDSIEFASLSAGINSTVGALKDSIAEAEARIDRELTTAQAIQKSALPQVFPPFPEIEKFDIFASMEPAREVGGDFYDVFLLDNDRLGLVIADVSGKGIPAALFMMGAKTEIEACLSSNMSLVDAISTANYHLCQGNDANMFVTVFAAVLNYSNGELEYVNAGHNPPMLRRAGTWEWLNEKSGPFMGAFETAKYRSYSTTIAEGDEILLYTDGVTEAMNPQEELYGEERLGAFLAEHTTLHPRKLLEAVRRDLYRWANGADQADDITMLCVEYGYAPEASASIILPARIDQLEAAQRFVHSELSRRKCPIAVQNKIDICIEELFVNVASYAYPDATDDTPGRVRISYIYHGDPQGITIEISDEGTPFNPLAKADPQAPDSIAEAKIGGLGIFMPKTIADDITYNYHDNCNVTSFTKNW